MIYLIKLIKNLHLEDAARLLIHSPRRMHIAPLLRDLHWLPIHYRSSYNILLYTYTSPYGLAPAYLADLIKKYEPT